ncbi:acetyltransferase (GNAT) family protein [Dysgonomonas alginatilytica]|uniref:Acetyltransferase (GNAT) family protein n=1 Tax=Dysgonomonas alginatilytica TaxID=1605892 RepID=A0A2V3PP81_9BACT|nr:GNAT family N-acetyltransferase [Dysgonomonas alginatilytica]PXV64094.1 acetyltransferase (GNAT) family protein [Dysgonomonas alginatilytica]
MQKVVTNNKEYNYITNYKNNEVLRNSLHVQTQKIWKFDFEKWYKSGHWGDNCLLYSLFDNNKIVSHITVSIIDFIVLGEKKQFIQLGTVCTDEEYRKQGLNRFLLEKVIEEWKSKSDLIYLYANDSVLDYYPLFGFVPVDEYQAIKKIDYKRSSLIVRKINIDNTDDYKLLYNKAKNNIALFKVSMVDNAGLIMFYCNYFDKFSFKENLFYIESLDTIVVAGYKENDLILYDILSTEKVEIDEVISAMITDQTQNVIIHFMPIDSEKYEIKLLKEEEDTTLFVMGNSKKLFETNKLIFPILSRT